jgi:hypothetical protein
MNVVVVLATPPLTVTGEPMTVPPAWNRTDPAGLLPSAAVTDAVSVTAWATVAGLGDAVSTVAVLTAWPVVAGVTVDDVVSITGR